MLQNGDLVNFNEKIEGVDRNYIEVKNIFGESTQFKLNHNLIITDVKDDSLINYTLLIIILIFIVVMGVLFSQH